MSICDSKHLPHHRHIHLPPTIMASTSSVALSAPYTVFPLSLPLHQAKAKDREAQAYRACYTAPVESRKRKRSNANSEVATAVDGEGVNIYDVHMPPSPRLGREG